MMPIGVEHFPIALPIALFFSVSLPMMPIGVEHTKDGRTVLILELECRYL